LAKGFGLPRVRRGVASPPSVTVLLPARNEEKGIQATLEALPLAALRAAGHACEVLVADGHSTDRTREVAVAWGARVVVQQGKGKGWGVRSAIPEIATDLVVMLDADGTYDPSCLPAVVARLADVDVVVGSRFKGRIDDGAMSRLNRAGNRLLSALASLTYGRRVTDVCTGLWGFRTAALRGLPLTAERYELEVDLYATSCRAGLRIAELPIHYAPRHGESGLSAWRDGLGIARAIVAGRFRRT
jgi:dolichol-phosphate mannosyltransferase